MKTAELYSKSHNNKTNLLTLGGLLGFTLLSGAVLTSSITRADNDSAVDDVSISVPTSCTMSSSGTNSHTAEINNGQYNSAVGTSTITTFCNDNNGFAIYAIGYSDDTLGNNTLINGTNTIATGTSTSGPTSGWAMKLSTITSPVPSFPIVIAGSSSDTDEGNTTDYSTFQQVPDDYTKVAYRAAGTDTGTNAEGSSFTTTYQVYISPTQPAGTYKGKVKYVMVHPSTAAPTIPVGFTWQSSSATRPDDADVTFTMQEFDATMCDAGEPGQIGWAKDSRDNKVYTIAKLADGKCWMTENLDLTGGTALSADDTDVTNAYISSFATSNNLTKTGDTIVLPASAIEDDEEYSLTDDTQFSIANYSYVFNSGRKENWIHHGEISGAEYVTSYSYYSWDAVTLGSGRSLDTENTDAPYSICPKGWKLPNSGADYNNGWKRGDYYALATAYGANLEDNDYDTDSVFQDVIGPDTIPNFQFASNYSYGYYEYGGVFGTYWSSTSSSSTDTAISFVIDSNIDVSEEYSRYYGQSVRCLAR